ncbi:MAG: hypothetical protein ACD_19C00012G0006, partial [uncultured bacterium]
MKIKTGKWSIVLAAVVLGMFYMLTRVVLFKMDENQKNTETAKKSLVFCDIYAQQYSLKKGTDEWK